MPSGRFWTSDRSRISTPKTCSRQSIPRGTNLCALTSPNLYHVVAACVIGGPVAYLPDESKKRTQNT